MSDEYDYYFEMVDNERRMRRDLYADKMCNERSTEQNKTFVHMHMRVHNGDIIVYLQPVCKRNQ